MPCWNSAGHVLSFRPDEDTECYLMQYVAVPSALSLPRPSLPYICFFLFPPPLNHMAGPLAYLLLFSISSLTH